MAQGTVFRVGLAIAAMLGGTDMAKAKDDGLAITPQMGWDNWNALGCAVSEDLMLQTANLIVKYGLRDLGYKYVIMDDCWSVGRNASDNHTLIADPEKFPRGIAALADDVHGLGLGWGMYSSAGSLTCAGYAGSLGHEETDARTFAAWGTDYLKYDNCHNEGRAGTQHLSRTRYHAMSAALNATGRPILYALCNWGEDGPWNWGATMAHSWRIAGDIGPAWARGDARCPCDGAGAAAAACALPGLHCSVLNIANKASGVAPKGGPGAWNDLDMLEVGNAGLSEAEAAAHFSVWSALKSPLIMGNDLRAVRPADLAILANPAVLAINQDPLGTSAVRLSLRYVPANASLDAVRDGGGNTRDDEIYPSATPLVQTWAGPLLGTTNTTPPTNDILLLVISSLRAPTHVSVPLTTLLPFSHPSTTTPPVDLSFEIRDVWSPANRMSDADAAAIIAGTDDGTVGVGGDVRVARVNVSRGGWAAVVGAAGAGATRAGAGDEGPGTQEAETARRDMVLGRVVGSVAMGGSVSAAVDAHACRMFRLRAVSGSE